jgi:hypothetical protein
MVLKYVLLTLHDLEHGWCRCLRETIMLGLVLPLTLQAVVQDHALQILWS